MVHEHQWVFAGELALTLTEAEMQRGDIEFRRLEYCVDCGMVRVQFGANWAVWSSEATKQWLAKYSDEHNVVLKNPPKEFRLTHPRPSPQRLGRGLADLSQLPPPGDLMRVLAGGKK